MTKDIFIDKIRNHKALKDLFFIVAAQTETDTTIVGVDNHTHSVKMTFNYNVSGIVWKLNLAGDCSLYETKRWLDAIIEILD